MQAVLKKTEEILRSYLGLKYHLVAVRLMKDENSVEGFVQPETPVAFCQRVRGASISGDSYVYGLDHEKCSTAQVVLGLRDLRYTKVNCRVTPPETRKVLVSPLNAISDLPEVVLAILTPKQMMDLTIILYARKSAPLLAEFAGEHACAEFFAKPYLEGKPNVSLLCSGAREVYSDFRDNEVIFGAPVQVYVEAAETIERITKMGGALCGCRMSDLPTEIADEFEKIGFSRGIDYFFGKVNGRNIRVYLNRDLDGRLGFITIHTPLRISSEDAAESAAQKLRPFLTGPYFVNRRGYWLDLMVRGSEGALGIDLFDSMSIKAAIERFVERITQYLGRVKATNSHGEG